MSYSSLFIPHVFSNFSSDYISNCLTEFGDVERVDLVSKMDRNGKPFNAAYIHFKNFYNTVETNKLINAIDDSGSYKFYHDGPWYWIVLPNTAKKHIPGGRKTRIDLGDNNSISVKTPEKQFEMTVPGAPMKKIVKTDNNTSSCRNLELELGECDAEFLEDEIKMAEIETELDKEEAVAMIHAGSSRRTGKPSKQLTRTKKAISA
jgi:hypothetical protein